MCAIIVSVSLRTARTESVVTLPDHRTARPRGERSAISESIGMTVEQERGRGERMEVTSNDKNGYCVSSAGLSFGSLCCSPLDETDR